MAMISTAEVLTLTGKTVEQTVLDAAVSAVQRYTGRLFNRATRPAWIVRRGSAIIAPDHPVRAVYMANRGRSTVARVTYTGAGSSPAIGVEAVVLNGLTASVLNLSSFVATTGLAATAVSLTSTKTVAQALAEVAAVAGWSVDTLDANLAALPAMMLCPGKFQGLPGATFFMDLCVPADPLDVALQAGSARVLDAGRELGADPVFLLYNAGWDDAEVPAAWKSLVAQIATDMAETFKLGGVLGSETIGDYSYSVSTTAYKMASILDRHATQLAFWMNHDL